MKEEKAVAILMGNLKGSKNKPSDLITFADATRTLLKHKKWGIKEMTNYFGVSQYMLRQIDKIHDLDDKLKNIIIKEEIGIEIAYHLWRIQYAKERGLNDALNAVKLFQNMTSEEVRTFMHFLIKNPNLSLEQCVELADKTNPKKIKILALPMDEKIYKQIEKEAQKSKLKIHQYILKNLGVKI